MDHESVLEQIVRSLSFDVEAVPHDNVVQVTSTSKSTPLNLKVKVRKKNEAAIQDGFISVPKVGEPDSIPERIRLVSSDQTLMTFDVLMETDLTQKPLRKPRKHIFDVFRPGVCLGEQRDDDNYPYMPKSEGSNSSRSDEIIKQNVTLSKMNENNVSASPNRSFRHKTFFGKCKPGGCLDPPFSEDKYSYNPATLKQIIPVQNISKKKSLEYKDDSSRSKYDDKNVFKKQKKSIDSSSLQKTINKQGTETNSILSLYQAESMRTSTTYSNSIITYPPAVTSSDLRTYDDKIEKNRIFSENRFKKSLDENAGSYYIPPKKINQLNQNSEYNVSDIDQKSLSRKEEDINMPKSMQPFQVKENELFVNKQKSNKFNSKGSDSFEKNVESFQVKAPELNQVLKHQTDNDFKSENTDTLGKKNESQSFFNKNKSKPKYPESSHSEATKTISSDHFNVASSNLIKANDDKYIAELHNKKISAEIYQLQSSKPSDNVHLINQDGQENQSIEQNEIHKPEILISSRNIHSQNFGFKADKSFDKKADLLLKEALNVTKDYDKLTMENVNTNKNDLDIKENLQHVRNITDKIEPAKTSSFTPYNTSDLIIASDVHKKYIDSDDNNGNNFLGNENKTHLNTSPIAATQILDTKDHEIDITAELNQMLSKNSKLNYQDILEENLITKQIEKQSMESGTNIPYPTTKNKPGIIDQNILKSDTLNNVLDKGEKDETLDVLQNSKENVKNNANPLNNSENATLLSKTSLAENKDNLPARYPQILSKDARKYNDADKQQILNDRKVLKVGSVTDTGSSHFQVAEYKKDERETKFDTDQMSETSRVEKFNKLNVEENLDFNIKDNIILSSLIDQQPIYTLRDTKVGNSNNRDIENFAPADSNSFKLRDIGTPYSSRQDVEKIQEGYFVDVNNERNSNNSTKPLQNLKKYDINEDYKTFVTKDGRAYSDVKVIDTNADSSLTTDTKHDVSGFKTTSLAEENITLLQSPASSKSVLKTDTISVEIDLAIQSYLNDNKERVLKSFDSDKIPERFSKDSITIIKSKIRSSISNDIKIPIDSENDLSIQIRKTNVRGHRGSKFENYKQVKKINLTTGDNVSTVGTKFESEPTNEVLLRNSLITMYEQELIPLQNIIKELKEEFDMLAKQKNIFNDKLKSFKTSSKMRLIKVNKKCGCTRKQL